MSSKPWAHIVREIIEACDDPESKLDVLTTIGVNSSVNELFIACEEVRNDLCCEEGETKRDNILSSKDKVQFCMDSGNEEGYNYSI